MDSSKQEEAETQTQNESIDDETLEETAEEIKHPNRSKTSPSKTKLKTMLELFLKRVSLLILGYLICYFNFSILLPIIGICTIVYYESVKSKTAKRIQTKVWASNSMTKDDLLEIAKELPSWVTFPDKERAEWLNEIIAQMWPTLNCFIIKYARSKIQNNIRKKVDSFRFEDMDFGDRPPKIDGVKVYNKFVSKEAIIIDFEVFYDGDCNINFSVSGTQVGRIKDFQMGVELRVVLKPILLKAPVVGGIQLFFLNVPDISFELDGFSGIPGFNYIIRQKIEEIINKKLVFPNKITKRFTKTIEAAELKAIEPEGVLRVHVFEAKDLEKKDVTGKSDPYVILNVGAQTYKSHVIKRELNPQWDCYCEFIILDPVAQQLYYKLYDQDDFSEDDFLGSGVVDIYNAIVEDNDQWFDLEKAKHGKIHFRFSWLGLSSDFNDLELALEETKLIKNENVHTALLVIYVESASNLKKLKPHKNPDPYIVLTVGKNQTKSRVKRHTINPDWQQGFYLLVKNPENDSLIINIIDKQTDINMDTVFYNIRELFHKPNLQISKEEIPCHDVPGSGILLSLQLRILHNSSFEDCDIDSDPDDSTEKVVLMRNSKRCRKSSQNRKAQINLANNEEKKIFQAVEEHVQKSSNIQTLNSPTVRTSNFLLKPENFGRIELSLIYNDVSQKLTVIVHRAGNLVMKHPSNIPDPYVKVRLCDSDSAKYKTKIIVDSCDPIYEEKFEFLLSESLLESQQLVVTVKDRKMFTSRILGQVIIQLCKLKNVDGPLRDWFDLCEEEVSD